MAGGDAQAARESQVTQQLQNMVKSLEQLDTTVESLELRLSRVLMPIQPTPSKVIDRDRPETIERGNSLVGVAEDLLAYNKRLQAASQRICSLLQRCEA